MPSAVINISMVTRVPDPGLPTLKRLPLEVLEFLDAGFLTRKHRQGFRIDREDRAQITVGAAILELR